MVTVNVGVGDPEIQVTKDVTVVLLDAVYVAASGIYFKAFAGIVPTPPAVGFISKVINPTTGELRTEKILAGFVGLPPGAPMFLSDTVPGGITPVPPAAPGTVVQRVGVAVSATAILIQPTDTEQTVNG